jgi:small subunit ribosomal protein S8
MSMSDPIADMLTRIRNGQRANKLEVRMPASKMKLAMGNLLREEGFVGEVREEDKEGKRDLVVQLKYYRGQPVIEILQRVSSPGRRVYKGKKELPTVRGGLGISIVSTSKGLMTDKAARAAGEGGEIVAFVA